MLKKLLDGCLKVMLAIFDHRVDEKDIHEFVMKHYNRITQTSVTSDILDRDLKNLEILLIRLGWISEPARRAISEQTSERRDWQGYNWLAEGNCFGSAGIEPGCGQFLDWMENCVDPGNSRQLSETLEKLLRQVEVKRERSLRKFTRAIPVEQQSLERCDISILFSRTARRRQDLRFLNAALKMNEWYMDEVRHYRSDVCISRLLTALAEQEISAQELLAC